MAEKAMGGQELAIGDRLAELEGRFRQWRTSRSKGERIPAQLWAAAVDMAREHGVPRVANRLRLSTLFLNKRLAATAGQSQAEAVEPEFVELLRMPAEPAPAAASARIHECVVELHNAQGAKMRVELNAGGLAGLAHLCRTFWSAT